MKLETRANRFFYQNVKFYWPSISGSTKSSDSELVVTDVSSSSSTNVINLERRRVGAFIFDPVPLFVMEAAEHVEGINQRSGHCNRDLAYCVVKKGSEIPLFDSLCIDSKCCQKLNDLNPGYTIEQVTGYPTIMRFRFILRPRLQRLGTSNVTVEVVVCKELIMAQILCSMNPKVWMKNQ
nr:hypothetical protein [Tanacetum cinerariifolium]